MSEVDIRGEPCGMPVLRVEKFLIEKSGGAAFSVVGDDAQTMDQLRLLASRHGWRCDVTPQGRGEYRADFVPKKA